MYGRRALWMSAMLLVGTAAFSQATGRLATEVVDHAGELAEEGKSAEARKLLESVLKSDSHHARACYLLGRIAFSLKNYDDAAAWLEKAVGQAGAESDYHAWLGRTYAEQVRNSGPFSQLSRAPKIKTELERALELDPANLAARMGLIKFLLRAPGFLGGSKAEAKRQAEEVRKRNPLLGHAAFGVVYETEKRWDLVEQEYLAARREASETPDPYYWLGGFYRNRGRYDEAFEVFEALWRRSPHEARAWYEIGCTGALSGKRLDRAEECLKSYVEHQPRWDHPSLGSARYWLGQVYEKRGSVMQARREYQLALEQEPRNEQAKQALKKLK